MLCNRLEPQPTPSFSQSMFQSSLAAVCCDVWETWHYGTMCFNSAESTKVRECKQFKKHDCTVFFFFYVFFFVSFFCCFFFFFFVFFFISFFLSCFLSFFFLFFFFFFAPFAVLKYGEVGCQGDVGGRPPRHGLLPTPHLVLQVQRLGAGLTLLMCNGGTGLMDVVMSLDTLRASLSGTFLQTRLCQNWLHTIYISAQLSAPSERIGY